ncbi:MAG: beta-N-acetylhexosaminidase [Rickettsiales bacterium]|nr:beta-N-acetylhexosaminidase [Rickettsiales bacterium]
MSSPSAVIYGCEGLSLSADERAFFADEQPLGFILFARNCDNPSQLSDLVASLKETVSHVDVPVLIDQEGGRVARLKPPHWRDYPAAERFVNLAKADEVQAVRACYLNARLMAEELHALGINTNCAPVADLRLEGAHDIIGDRAFGAGDEQIAPLAAAQAEGLMDGGVIPVLKHIPGHGRALVDSHESLPRVSEPLDVLKETDFKPFQSLGYIPMGMTAHIVYEAIDKDLPATLSPTAISLIRELIGFGGLLMTDDLSMKALQGNLGDLASQALKAGCDIVLHCNGKMDEMQSVARGVRALNDAGIARNERAFSMIDREEAIDVAAVESELAKLLDQAVAA